MKGLKMVRLAAAVSLVLGFAAVIGTMEASAKVRVRLLTLTKTYLKAAADEFNRSQKDIEVKIEIPPGGWDVLFDKLLTAQAAGSPYDMVWAGSHMIDSFIKYKVVIDMAPYVNQAKMNLGAYHDSAIAAGRQKEGVYGLPSSIYTLVTYYNKSLLAKAGLDEPRPQWDNSWTWDDYTMASKKILSVLGTQRKDAVGGAIDWNMERIAVWLWHNGGDLWNQQKTASDLTSPEALDTFKYWGKGFSEGSVVPDPWLNIVTGRVGLIVDGTWRFEEFRMAAKDRPLFGAAPVPRRKAVATAQYVDHYCIVRGTKHPKEAFKFIQFCLSKRGQELLTEHPDMGVAASKAITEQNNGKMFKGLDRDSQQVILTSPSYARPYPFVPRWMRLQDQALQIIRKQIGTKTLSAEGCAQELARMCNKHQKETASGKGL